MTSSIEAVENWQTSDLGTAAATLLVREIASLSFMNAQRYLATCDPVRDTMYVSSETDNLLLAAALVTHRSGSLIGGNTRTFVGALAVSPEHRGTRALPRINAAYSSPSSFRWDTMIAIGPASPAFAVVASKLGFSNLNPDNDKEMEAKPATILSYKLQN